MVFKCIKCGECCGPVSFTIPMFKRFKDKAQRGYNLQPFEIGVSVVPLTESLSCVFLDENKYCVIYNDRPMVCRQQGRIEKLPCPHNKGYEDSPYPQIYEKMLNDLRR